MFAFDLVYIKFCRTFIAVFVVDCLLLQPPPPHCCNSRVCVCVNERLYACGALEEGICCEIAILSLANKQRQENKNNFVFVVNLQEISKEKRKRKK